MKSLLMVAITSVLVVDGADAGDAVVGPTAREPSASVGDGAGKPAVKTAAATEAWGAAQNGLIASLHATKASFAADEPMTFQIRVRNVSDQEIAMVGLRSELSPCTFDFRFGNWEWRQNQPQLLRTPLKPGETKTVTVTVPAADREAFLQAADGNLQGGQHVRLAEGVVEVWAAYVSPNTRREHPRYVETNKIEITIGKPTTIQRK